jgi:hypothetical protein
VQQCDIAFAAEWALQTPATVWQLVDAALCDMASAVGEGRQSRLTGTLPQLLATMGCGSSRVFSLAREEPCGGCKAVLSLGGAIAPASPHSSPIHAAFTLPAGPAASLHSSADGCSPPPRAAAAAFSNPPTEQPGAPLASAFASAATGRAAASGIQYGISPQDSCKHETEAERLAVLRALHVTHQPSGPRFGAITAVLRGLFQLPVASVYLLEEDEVLVVPDEEGILPWEAHP